MSEIDSVFNENVEYLIKAQECVRNLETLKAQRIQQANQEKKLKKNIAAEEKSIADEINSTLKKRKAEIEHSYDAQLDANLGKKKSIKAKRDKKKNQRMGQRVEKETADVKEENRQLSIEMKTLFKKEHVPVFCKSRLYYALFMPKGISEVIMMLVGIIIGIVGIPSGVFGILCATVFKEPGSEPGTLITVLIFAGTIILVFLLYFAVFNLTKVKHRDTLLEGRKIRDKIRANNKQIRAVKNAINKDKDESGYNLGKFDKRLQELDAESTKISKNKKAALTVFENETKQVLIDEINNRRIAKLEEMKAERRNLEGSMTSLDSQIQEQSLFITDQFEAYLGKDFCREDKLTDLIALMEEGSAETVSEAIAVYKGQNKK